MFTGLIEQTGRIEFVRPEGECLRIGLRTSLDPGAIGASLAVDGVCLTLVERDEEILTFVVGPESLARTSLGRLQPGDEVNLERPLRLGDRLGGHLVQGHVDGTGAIAASIERGETLELEIEAPAELARLLVPKGSVTVDGISLTVNRVEGPRFAVWLIPHTRAVTALGRKRQGSVVNLEVDLIGKYVERLLAPYKEAAPQSRITLDFLKEHGFAD